jgi:UDPglucose 6-dehydrogenase
MSVAAQRLRVTAIGIGYLGLTHAACMAELGHEVLAIDTDQERVARVSAGKMPFFEPELEELMRKGLEIGQFGEVHFLCVGTPQGADGAADLSQVTGAVDALAPYLQSPCLIVGKSTVPVGTARKLTDRIHAAAPAGSDVELAWNPEFLREGNAVQDTLRPDRLVFGVTSERADSLLRQVYEQPLSEGIPALTMGLETAELVKVSANSFLATKISFINAVADTCEAAGADVTQLVEALALDERIGRKSMSPGLGFGGGCLPKDIRAYQARAKTLGADSIVSLLSIVDDINKGRRTRVVDMAREVVGGSLSGKRITALGVAFKPNSDDIRDSPSLDVCGRLAAEGAIVTAHDPMALENASRVRPELRCATSVLEAAEGAELVVHLTEWTEYRSIDPAALAEVVAQRNVIDARCVLDRQAWQAAGWSVRALGRAAL